MEGYAEAECEGVRRFTFLVNRKGRARNVEVAREDGVVIHLSCWARPSLEQGGMKGEPPAEKVPTLGCTLALE